MPNGQYSIFWFRKSLRLHDNPALIECLKQSPQKWWPVFFVDPKQIAHEKCGALSRNFLIETLVDLDHSLQKLGSRLIVLRGDPTVVFEDVIQSWKPKSIYCEKDTEPFSVTRDEQVEQVCLKWKVEFIKIHGHTLYEPEDVVRVNGGKAPLTFQGLVKAVNKLPPPALPLNAPCSLPPLGELDTLSLQGRLQTMTDFDIPELNEFGHEMPATPTRHKGGETKALELFEKYFENKKKVALFEKPKTSPAAYNPADTTVMSPHLRHGSLSIRFFYHRLMEIYRQIKNHSQPPVSLLAQMYWREFYYVVAAVTPNYSKMVGNPVCLQIDWWLPDGPQDDRYPEAQVHFEKWKNAQTGYPWIDAIMTQLRQEGWIHHLARHSAACFLTRGDLFVSWERGAEAFEELLLDYDHALNIGNWLWLSASAYFHQYYRVYSPVTFPKSFDKTGKYVRKYLPQLAKFPTEYIYEPWKAPLSVQKQAGCIIGKDYPLPIVDHAQVSKVNLAKMKQAYEKGQRGSATSATTSKTTLKRASSPSNSPSKKSRK